MISGIEKHHTFEHIVYSRIDEEKVKKYYYNEEGKKTKEKEINVRKVKQKRKSHRDTEDFFEDMIWNYGYREIL